MDCRDIQNRLSAYHDGELSTKVADIVRRHLKSCERCTAELAAIRGMSSLMAASETPPAVDDWAKIEAQLRHPPATAQKPSLWLVPIRWPRFVLAATVLVAVIVGLAAICSHDRMADISQFVAVFPRDPIRAEQLLLASYTGQPVDLNAVGPMLSYRPKIASGPPAGYALTSARLLQMPCCKCLQAIYSRQDGSLLCVFEHVNDRLLGFGDRPTITAMCAGQETRLVQIDDCLAAAWSTGTHRLTVVGAKDVGEVVRLVGHFSREDGTKM